ncbi:LOW QUALITY PROTEIN: motilin receptor [Fukomys damarensis]|uniref:LOW QUALITY PROTEIN: motilin receptor n=1 Tax=Fukomys damarensis TaxID=885580 RepID=UPI0005402FD6|nr:LOW QUALITY PROTEIN: motilin receptor [Fukomys damarensis]
MGSPWNYSEGPEGAWEPPWVELPPCDERRCSVFPLGALVPVTAVCLGLFAVGVTGNVVTVLLIGRYQDMRTTTNLYLGSMVVSDLLILLGLPFDLYRLWRSRPWVFGSLLCRLSLYLGEGCTYATLLHLTALSVERYLAICRPLRARVLVTRALIAALWVVALLSAGPFFFLVGVEQDPGTYELPDFNRTSQLALSPGAPPSPPSGPEAAALFSRECRPRRAQLGALRIMLWVTTAYFFLPFLCLGILYGLVGRQLWKTRGLLQGPAALGREKGHWQTVRVLLVVVLAFIVCWLPFHIGRIIYINTEETLMMYFSQYFNIVALQLFYLSASIKPILYNLISKKYRAAACKLLFTRQSKLRSFCPPSRGDPKYDTGEDTAGFLERMTNSKTVA